MAGEKEKPGYPKIKTIGLAAGYRGKPAVFGISFSVPAGSILAVIGPNGAGKSTLLKALTGELPPISGSVLLDGREVASYPVLDLSRKMALVLAERARPELLSCREVVAMGRFPYTGMMGRMSALDEEKTTEALSLVHAESLAERDFMSLSDGQKQRILLARAVCQEPEALVLDEPEAFLDLRYKLEILSAVRRLAKEKGTAVIITMHETRLALRMADHVLCLKDGSVFAYGPPGEVGRDGLLIKLYDLDRAIVDKCFEGCFF